MAFLIKWYDGHGGRPDYSKHTFDTVEKAVFAADLVIDTYGAGDDVTYDIVHADTKRKVDLLNDPEGREHEHRPAL